jgi:hypothetical protein
MRTVEVTPEAWALEKPETSNLSVILPRRVIIVLLAVVITVVRAAPSFVTPQLYAEDGALFSTAFNHGWHSLIEPIGGTLNLYGSLVALIASKAPLRQDLYIEKINGPFLFELKGTPAEYKAGLDRAIEKGWLVVLHESGTYVRFTDAGAALFA